uniref:UPAR/Ly6 domain-containing protein n=1 Tax=Plectus sambesii TaxID=2011161 RepID=A0A914W4H5_9BILA
MRIEIRVITLLLLLFVVVVDYAQTLSCFYCANGRPVNASLNSFYFTGDVDQCWPSVVHCLPVEQWCLFAVVYGQRGSNVSFTLSGCTTDPSSGWRPCERHRVYQPSISVSVTTCQCPWSMCNNSTFRSDALRFSRSSRTTIRLPTAAPSTTPLPFKPVAAFCAALPSTNISLYSNMGLLLFLILYWC